MVNLPPDTGVTVVAVGDAGAVVAVGLAVVVGTLVVVVVDLLQLARNILPMIISEHAMINIFFMKGNTSIYFLGSPDQTSLAPSSHTFSPFQTHIKVGLL